MFLYNLLIVVIVKFPESATAGALLHLFNRTLPDGCFWLSTKRYWQIQRMSNKQKYKKDSYTEKKSKAWNRGKRTQMPVTEGLAATDKG